MQAVARPGSTDVVQRARSRLVVLRAATVVHFLTHF